jgi:molecular chaperone GrpE
MTSQEATAGTGHPGGRDTAADDEVVARRVGGDERPGVSPADVPAAGEASGDVPAEGAQGGQAGGAASEDVHEAVEVATSEAGRDTDVEGADVEGADVEDVDIEIVKAERDEYLDALRRMQAEFDNFRKRTARQQSETFDRAVETVVERLLPALDALDLALAHVGSAGAGELEPAFVQIGSLLRDILAKEGLERIDADGVAFDPTVHDAVAHVPAEESQPEQDGRGEAAPAEPAVVETLRAGYRLKGRVLRPAMVKVRA